MNKSAIARRLGRHRDIIIEWLKAIEQQGLKGLKVDCMSIELNVIVKA